MATIEMTRRNPGSAPKHRPRRAEAGPAAVYEIENNPFQRAAISTNRPSPNSERAFSSRGMIQPLVVRRHGDTVSIDRRRTPALRARGQSRMAARAGRKIASRTSPDVGKSRCRGLAAQGPQIFGKGVVVPQLPGALTACTQEEAGQGGLHITRLGRSQI